MGDCAWGAGSDEALLPLYSCFSCRTTPRSAWFNRSQLTHLRCLSFYSRVSISHTQDCPACLCSVYSIHYSLFLKLLHAITILLLKTSVVSAVVLPFSFSSRLIRVPAAASPIAIAKSGSKDLNTFSMSFDIYQVKATDFDIMYWYAMLMYSCVCGYEIICVCRSIQVGRCFNHDSAIRRLYSVPTTIPTTIYSDIEMCLMRGYDTPGCEDAVRRVVDLSKAPSSSSPNRSLASPRWAEICKA